jgi:glycosyltransferase involved in cell wall biosynthesis
MNEPRVSVVMSVFNDERYILDAVESILNQTFRDFEFVIINDGSNDKTGEILSSFQDERIRLFDQANQGLTPSLNRGLALARGAYIARMDGDDLSDPTRLEKEVLFLDRNRDVGLVGTFAYRIDEQGRRIGLYTYKTTYEEIRENLWVDCPFCHSSVLFRKTCIERIGAYREKVGPAEDYDLWFRITEQFAAANIPEPLHAFRIDSQGITVNKRFDQLRSVRLVRRLAEERQKTGHDPLESWSQDRIDRTLDALFPRTPENVRTVLLDNLIYLAEIYYVTGDYRRSASWLFKYQRQLPLNARGLRLWGKLALALLLPPATLQRLKGASRAFHLNR